MGARQKLNAIYITLALGVAVTAGLLTQSKFVFCVALVVMIIVSIEARSIRPTQQRSKRSKHRPRRR